MNTHVIVAIAAILYLFATSLHLGADATLADSSLLTKIVAVSVAIVVLVRLGRSQPRFHTQVAAEQMASDASSEWCAGLAQCVRGRAWLLDERLRVVAADRRSEDVHRHIIDLVGKAATRDALAIVGEMKKGASPAEGIITYEGQQARLLLLPLQGSRVIMAITKET